MDCWHVVAKSHFEYGRLMGERFQDDIQRMAKSQVTLKNVNDTPEIRKVIKGYLSICEEQYPQYVEEIRGYAEGAGIVFDQLFRLHLDTELNNLGVNETVKINGCSTCMSNSAETFLIHSEDQIPELEDSGFLVHAVIQDSSEDFTAFCCPGFLPGNTFSFNGHGLAQSLNAVFQKKVHLDKLPRRFLIRAMLLSKDIDDAIKIARNQRGVANGFNMNYLQLKGGKTNMASVEIYGTPTGNVVNRCDVTDAYYHLNNYKQIDADSISDPSSVRREKTFSSVFGDLSVRPLSLAAILEVMSSRADPEYPVYRDGKEPDYLLTCAIGLFIVKADAIELRVYKSPPSSNEHSVHRYVTPKFIDLNYYWIGNAPL
ncbi:hypothetical protein CAPTEDRAFT_221158 [Capitella teleta]|uniref:Peptidase C45 hydrolase domain-containing protein n=1 Tax=Capitella teleta TaxID=283909 RepID=R7V1M9_CAPTE|nr:hypothetical protein CAPTEDRAFT_221158 [Capitella teleta]|eukprot:ELU12748.1 hypothetical protein CAPTEDRAFT_221158 [Capitella teleta]